MSVFAKQLSGRNAAAAAGPRGGAATVKAGAKAVAKNGRAAAGAGAGNIRAGISNPVKEDVTTKKASNAPPGRLANSETDDEEPDGGQMTCANRDLLRRMMADADAKQAADPPSDEDSGPGAVNDLGMSLRHKLGTPLAGGGPKRSVPTLVSPSSGGPPRVAASVPINVVATAQRPPQQGMSRVAMKASPQSPGSLGARPGSRGGSYAGVGIADAAGSSSAVGVAQRAQAGAARTAVPQRPGSSAGSVHSSGSPAGAGLQPSGSRRVFAGYAGMHAARMQPQVVKSQAKAPAPPGPASANRGLADPASAPRTGPRAFDMLREMEQKKAEAPKARDDPGGFVMPSDSEDEDEDGVAEATASQQDQPPPRGRANASGMSEVTMAPTPALSPEPAQHARESPAEYLELIKEEELACGAQARGSGTDSLDVGSAPPRGHVARSRSSDARAFSSSAPKAAPKGLRARSNDTRTVAFVSPAAAKPAAPAGLNIDVSDSSDDDSYDGSAPVPAAGKGAAWKADVGGDGAAWKTDVRQMVREFAVVERASADPQSVAPGVEQRAGRSSRRPPKAPAPAPVPAQSTTSYAAEVKPVRQGEELIYSKKPRDVDYTPATIEAYKQKYGDNNVKLGSLGPDLDDEGLLLKRAVQEKVKQFSKELHRINCKRQAAAPQPKGQAKVEAKSDARSKALEFAKQHVPRPKADARPAPAEKKSREAPPENSGEAELAMADWEEIRWREQRHFDDIDKVRQIRECLAQLGG